MLQFNSKFYPSSRPVAAASAVVGTLLLGLSAANAATATADLGVTITITETCAISSIVDVAFGSVGLLNADVTATGGFDVQCTNGTDYVVGLGAGLGGGGTVADRAMAAGGETVSYNLYLDPAHSQVWGVTPGTDTQAAIGNGTQQNYTVYGLVPVQTTPASGSYSDTVVISVTY